MIIIKKENIRQPGFSPEDSFASQRSPLELNPGHKLGKLVSYH